jgi:hypothetical protein
VYGQLMVSSDEDVSWRRIMLQARSFAG